MVATEGGSGRTSGGRYRFRVVDATPVPLRGHLLRLRLEQGSPRVEDLGPGREIVLEPPGGGEARTAEVLDLSVTGGKPTQRRLERTGELDILIRTEDAVGDGATVDIGWHVVGPPAAWVERAA